MTDSRTDLDEASTWSDTAYAASDPARSRDGGWPRVEVAPVMALAPLPRYGRLRAKLDLWLSRYDN